MLLMKTHNRYTFAAQAGQTEKGEIIMWQENWKRAVSIFLDVAPDTLDLDEDYAKNIVLQGYLERAEDEFGDAGIFEFACRPCWSREEQMRSRMCTDLGQPVGDWDLSEDAKLELRSAVNEIENSQ